MKTSRCHWGTVVLAVVATILSTGLPRVLAADLCLDSMLQNRLQDQPIQADGRVMPLSVYAGKIRKSLFPSKTCQAADSTTLYCLLSQGRRLELEQKFNCQITLKAEHAETQKLLGLANGEKKVRPALALRSRDTIAQTYHLLQQNGKSESGFGTDLSNLLMYIDRFVAIESGSDWKIIDNAGNWVSWKELNTPGRLAPNESVDILATGQLSRLTPIESRNVKLEKIYETFRPFTIAVVFCLLGFLFSLLALDFPKFVRWTKLMIPVVLVLQIAGMVLRVLISGRAPVTNMYETVMWVGVGTFSLSAFLGWRMKERRIWAVGFAGNSICLFMLSFATKMLDGTIQPLVPVLRDNFWLSTHVTTITLSYSCFALAWLMANFVLVLWVAGKRRLETVQKWNDVIRLEIQIGSVLLAAGIILGGIWADYSWGRFWGWDPKETWSLIALVIYAGILHGRYVGWFKDINFTAIAAFGFMFVLMAWFGVNYILAVGLHSYGFSSGGSMFLAAIFIAQVIVLTAVYMANPRNPSRPSSPKTSPKTRALAR